MNFALRLYRFLARAFPHEFKLVYGTDVIQLGEDAVEDIARTHGIPGLIRLVLDIAIRVPIEYLSEMRRDLVYSLRTLAKSRGFTAVGVLSMGLGLSMTGVTSSEMLNMILRDAPGLRDPSKLVALMATSYPYIEHYRDEHDLFSGVAAFDMAVPYNVLLEGGASAARPERIFGQLVSPDYFEVAGVTAERGRVFDPALDKRGGAPVAFISDRFWREHLGSDPGAVGETIRVNGQTATIVGIGPKDFLGAMPFVPADVFVPTTVSPSMAPELSGDVLHKRDARQFTALLRLAPGVTLRSAEAGLDTVTRRLDEDSLDPARNAKGRRVTLVPGGRVLPIPRELVPVITAFMIVLNALLVGIACLNLANMQLARATARRKEVAIRLSVGASRFRLIRQLLTENALLALGGGCMAIAMAFWVAGIFKRMKMPFNYPVNFDWTPDWRVMLIVFAVSLAAAVGFGLAPALTATKTDLATTLKGGIAGQMRGYRRFGIRNLLMTVQVAGSLALLLVAGFMIIGYSNLTAIEVAFDPASMYLFSLDPVRDGYTGDKAAELFDNLTERLNRAAGVREVALTQSMPFTPQAAVFTLTAPGVAGSVDQVVHGVAKNTIGANFFASLSVRMMDGREFDARDQRVEPGPAKALPVVINRTAASSFFGGSEPVGRRILDGAKTYEVIGVVKDLSAPMSSSDVSQISQTTSVVPVVYLPLTRSEIAHPSASGMVVMVRTDHGPDTMEGVRRELASIDPNLAAFNVKSLAEQISDSVSFIRIGFFMYGGMGAFGLVLASIGLAGVTAYSVARRRKEIGIRMALGARRGQVLRLVLREGGWLVLAGSVMGLMLAFVMSRVLASLFSMFGPSFMASAHDPRLLVGAPVLLAGLAMLACYVPARRSTKIDPLVALREE